MGYFEIQALNRQPIFNFENLQIFFLISACFVYIDPEQLYGINSFKGRFIFVCLTMCDRKMS